MDKREMNILPLAPGETVQWGAQIGKEGRNRQEQNLKRACADFESIFVYQMIKTMRSAVPRSGLLNKMTGKDTYEMMMDQKLSEALTARGGLGLQEMLFRQLQRKE